MRSSSMFAAATAFVSSAVATCLTDDSALHVANNFKTLISDYSNASATAFLTADFTDYSDSVIELINYGCPNGPVPLGVATFTDRDSFEAGQGGQPNIPFNILNVWHNCDTVFLRWRTPTPGFVQPEQQVTGIIILETTDAGADAPEQFLINTVYSEFNSGAWLYDLAVFVPDCPAPGTASATASATAASTASGTASSTASETASGTAAPSGMAPAGYRKKARGLPIMRL